MDIKQLTYFRTIVEEGNVTGAAKRLFMAQPSLSQQLKLLESELGVHLIERGNRRIRLTEAGRILYERTGMILDLIQTTVQEVQEAQAGQRGTLAIGTIASSGVTLLPGIIRDFHEQYPEIQFQLREGDTQEILELLQNKRIEIGIVRSGFDPAFYHFLDLPSEPMLVAMSERWQGERGRGSIALADLKNKPLLLHKSNEMMIKKCCKMVGFDPFICCSGDDIRTLLVLANEGIGLAVVPRSVLGLIPSQHLLYRELENSPLEIKKAVVWLRHRRLSTAATRFLQILLSKGNDLPKNSDN
ncbi:MAG: LysR family transcriptional regulator [Sporomusaceae bacterium]|nr:LysR family transcriptional regulator [Sporomusaceae bacterium]